MLVLEPFFLKTNSKSNFRTAMIFRSPFLIKKTPSRHFSVTPRLAVLPSRSPREVEPWEGAAAMAQEHQEYIQQKVNPVLENLVTQLLLERPEPRTEFRTHLTEFLQGATHVITYDYEA